MALYTKCIFKERNEGDGIRISVMSRHTLDDGVTPDMRITVDLFDEHLQELAPRSKLVGAYYKGMITWDEFEQSYVSDIREAGVTEKVDELAMRAMRCDLTILCVEDSPMDCDENGRLKCHRRVLAQECQARQLNLIVEHH